MEWTWTKIVMLWLAVALAIAAATSTRADSLLEIAETIGAWMLASIIPTIIAWFVIVWLLGFVEWRWNDGRETMSWRAATIHWWKTEDIGELALGWALIPAWLASVWFVFWGGWGTLARDIVIGDPIDNPSVILTLAYLFGWASLAFLPPVAAWWLLVRLYNHLHAWLWPHLEQPRDTRRTREWLEAHQRRDAERQAEMKRAAVPPRPEDRWERLGVVGVDHGYGIKIAELLTNKTRTRFRIVDAAGVPQTVYRIGPTTSTNLSHPELIELISAGTIIVNRSRLLELEPVGLPAVIPAPLR